MTTPAETPAAAPEATLSDYIRTENAREQREARGDLEPAPTPEPTPPPDVDAPGGTAAEKDTAAEPVEASEAKAETERNADGTFKPKSKRSDPQTRIDIATARQREAERRAEAAEARARELEARLQPSETGKPAEQQAETPTQAAKKPVLDDFLNEADPYAALAEAVADWKVTQALAARDAREAAELAQAEHQDRVSTIMDAGAQKYPDFREVLTNGEAKDIVFQPYAQEAIFSADNSADVVYYLGTHASEARALAALPPLAAALEIGRVSARLAAAPSGPAPSAVPTTRAKPTIKPVGASPVAPEISPPDPEKASLKEHMRYWNAQERKQREASRGA